MHPPFLFFLKKRNGPCTVQRETALRPEISPVRGNLACARGAVRIGIGINLSGFIRLRCTLAFSRTFKPQLGAWVQTCGYLTQGLAPLAPLPLVGCKPVLVQYLRKCLLTTPVGRGALAPPRGPLSRIGCKRKNGSPWKKSEECKEISCRGGYHPPRTQVIADPPPSGPAGHLPPGEGMWSEAGVNGPMCASARAEMVLCGGARAPRPTG